MFDWLKKKKEESGPEVKKEHPMFAPALGQLAIQEDDVVLQVGFGFDLELLMSLAIFIEKGRLAGIDGSQAAVENAKKIFADQFSTFRADFRNAVVSKIPFYDGSFTKVVSLDQMHSWVSLERGFDEIHRVLAPGGTFVLVWGVPLDQDTQVEGRRIINSDEVNVLLKRSGFYHPEPIVKIVGDMRYYLLASKRP